MAAAAYLEASKGLRSFFRRMSTPDKRDWLKRTASTVTGESVEDSPPENAPGRLMRMLSTVTGGGSPSSKSSPPKDKKLPSPGRLSRMFQSVGRKQIAINNVDNGGKDRAANAFAAHNNEYIVGRFKICNIIVL